VVNRAIVTDAYSTHTYLTTLVLQPFSRTTSVCWYQNVRSSSIN